jgi:phenylpropionate dioxygenase-like ring-hydroxylating dioxygenase large terminal subunit
VLERQGFLWVYGVPGIMPEREPGRFPLTDDAAYTTDVTELRADGTIYSVAENALDVPHTAYLHGGLFRSAGGRNRTLEVEVRTYGDRIEAEYFGEAAPTGLAGRVLAPGGGTVTHVDRFILPSITQVEYRLGSRTHILVTVAMTPEADHRTRLFAVVGYRAPLPGRLLKPILRPLFLKIFNQDAEMLRLQQQNLDRFGGEQFASIGADILGPGIMRLMKQRERGENGGEPHVEKRKIVI